MNEELSKIPQPKSKDFKLDDIHNVNHNPHPYCITPKHLLPNEMYIDNRTIKEAESQGARCGMWTKGKKYRNGFISGGTRCDLSHDEHTSDKVLFLKALVDKPIKELSGLNAYLKKIVPVMKRLKIDGVGFIELDKSV